LTEELFLLTFCANPFGLKSAGAVLAERHRATTREGFVAWWSIYSSLHEAV
jgi:hypothetical protein